MRKRILTLAVVVAVLAASAAMASAGEITLWFAMNGSSSGSTSAVLDPNQIYDFAGSAQTGLTADTAAPTGSVAGSFSNAGVDYVWLVSTTTDGVNYTPLAYLSDSAPLATSSVLSFAQSGGSFTVNGLTGLMGMKLEYGYTASNAIVTGSGIVVAKVVPEPSGLLALGTGLVGLGFAVRRRLS